MPQTNLVRNLLDSVFARARRLRAGSPTHDTTPSLPTGAAGAEAVMALARSLLAERSQFSSLRIARQMLTAYRALDDEGKAAFLTELAQNFSPDPQAVRRALDAHDQAPSAYALSLVSKAAEAPRQELLRQLNQAPMATAELVAMRADLLRILPQIPDLRALDEDFVHLLRSWFNRGFLVMRRIDWSSPADLLERIIRYEAVHSIAEWGELRDRLQPADRRCYGFFHPAMGDEPLIFVEVALSEDIPASIQSVLAPARTPLDTDRARVAVFYSISNCQNGLAGISFGQFLIKQVAEDLLAEFPQLHTFVTLSPIPGFQRWLQKAAASGDDYAQTALAHGTPANDWTDDDPRTRARMALAARYFLTERDERGRLIDPVARFHVGNGARVERLCWMGDTSPRGMAQSGGLMVNYLYDLERAEANHTAYARHSTVAASPALQALAPVNPPR